MLVKLERNGLDRVPSRAKLVATVTPWRVKNRTMPASESQCDKPREHEPEAVTLLAIADDLLAVALAPMAAVVVPSESASRPESDGPLTRWQRVPAPWGEEDAKLIDWFQSHSDQLPREPFKLFDHATVCDPTKFYAALEGDIKAGSNGPRAVGLRNELCQLRRRYETGIVLLLEQSCSARSPEHERTEQQDERVLAN